MLVSCACDWGRPSRNWLCAWTPSDYYRFLLSVSRSRFLSTDLQSAFLTALRKRAVLRLPDSSHQPTRFAQRPKGGLSQWLDFTATRIQAAKYRHSDLTDGLGSENARGTSVSNWLSGARA